MRCLQKGRRNKQTNKRMTSQEDILKSREGSAMLNDGLELSKKIKAEDFAMIRLALKSTFSVK